LTSQDVGGKIPYCVFSRSSTITSGGELVW
jgi:hypothetical protein